MAPYVIRPFVPEDAPGVQSLVITVQHEHGVKITLADQPDLFDIPGFYRKGAGNFWVAVDDHQNVIGSIAIVDLGNGDVALRKVFLAPNQRGSGIAQELMNTVYAWMRTQGCHSIYLGTIGILKAAIRFYIKNGFEIVAKSALPSAFPIMSTDDVFMSKKGI
ncbi:acetyltransferase [Achlya hypogyna]|uniref:Acetyltransferase n=1 Tax=Achlya hypogyna TaxID=1202772 RepID=A0A1V9ZIX4_ACHHY|nr:acetyltransferase [Achlya hypogyna]